MATRVENIIRIALNAFNRKNATQSDKTFVEKFQQLKSALSSLTYEDVGLNIPALEKEYWYSGYNLYNSGYRSGRSNPPSVYIEVFKNEDITVVIFVLRNAGKIPLHDHPTMHGLLKVLWGTVRIKTYSWLAPNDPLHHYPRDGNHCLAIKQGTSVLTPADEPSMLFPAISNIHEVEACGGTAAFLDILTPPYAADQGRDCQYFRDVGRFLNNTGFHDRDELIWLRKISPPHDFWTESRPYEGPSLRHICCNH